MPFPKPIRVDVDNWACHAQRPVIPKAGIQRLRDKDGAERYLLIKWDIDRAKRVLMGVHDSLEKANDMVLYDVVQSEQRLPPNIHLAHGAQG
ncbi:hypothetical protein AB4Y63_13900 [Leifsonia sp. YAF41]|uniref:hypothetical protein n=1 Tax=Leifsonia sp. YAF41 TaxID=3233086 RepID=UPI003F9A3DEE